MARSDRRPAPPAETPTARLVATSARTEIDDLSAPATKVAVPEAARKWVIAILVGVAIVVGIGRISKIASRKDDGQQQSERIVSKIVCQDASAHETRGCQGLVSNTAWTEKFKAADGQEANGMMLCSTLGVESEQTQQAGTTWWRFRAIGNPTSVQYRFFPGDQPCPSKLP